MGEVGNGDHLEAQFPTRNAGRDGGGESGRIHPAEAV